MNILFCTACSAVIDQQEDDYHIQPDTDNAYCDDCYKKSPMYCEDHFNQNGGCRCGEHVVLPAEPDVGINHPYLELR